MKLEELAAILQELPARIERASVSVDKAIGALTALDGIAEQMPEIEFLPAVVDSSAPRDAVAAYFYWCLLKETVGAEKTDPAAVAYHLADCLLAAR